MTRPPLYDDTNGAELQPIEPDTFVLNRIGIAIVGLLIAAWLVAGLTWASWSGWL